MTNKLAKRLLDAVNSYRSGINPAPSVVFSPDRNCAWVACNYRRVEETDIVIFDIDYIVGLVARVEAEGGRFGIEDARSIIAAG